MEKEKEKEEEEEEVLPLDLSDGHDLSIFATCMNQQLKPQQRQRQPLRPAAS